MYCILVTGISAAGKNTMAETIAERLKLPVISKDTIEELLFDNVGFQSREEKVNLGIASLLDQMVIEFLINLKKRQIY